ncbi:MAG: hypothetical protein PHF44_02710 [Candidatus Pacebacteria bacterium]|nr:hypothetical protein [Candidatus Paceibacterota bacterium]
MPKLIIKKLKNFVKGHDNVYKIVLIFWGFFWITRARIIFSKIKRIAKQEALPKNSHKVLILAIRSIPTTNLVYFDAVFGHAFKKLGCAVKMLYCDGFLNSCDANTVFYNQKPQCFVCKTLGPQVRNSLGLDCIFYRQYVSDSDIKDIKEKVAKLNTAEMLNYEYLGVNVGIHAQSSAVRYFLFGSLNLDNPKEVEMLKEKLILAMIATKVASNIVEKEKPDRLFLLHGVYSTWAPFLDYFRKEGIDTIVYMNMSQRIGNFLFRRNNRANDIMDVKDKWLDFSRIPLTAREEEKVDSYFKQRLLGITPDQGMYAKNFDNTDKEKSLQKLAPENKYSRRYVLYANVAWDCAIEGQISNIFKDVFSWIDTTIEFFKKNKNYQLIIKSHPAELIWEGSSKTMADYIFEKHGSLPDNITILKPDAPFSAYNLVTSDTVGLVFNGTAGLELAVLGMPVLVVADVVHYKNAGVVYQISTPKEYLDLLENPGPAISFAKENIKLAKKYAYFFLFKSMIRIPFYREDQWSVIDWRALSDPKKLLDREGYIMQICKKIVNGEDIIIS